MKLRIKFLIPIENHYINNKNYIQKVKYHNTYVQYKIHFTDEKQNVKQK